MDLTQAKESFDDLKTMISEHWDYLSSNEIVTRVLLVDPVLEILGWCVREPNIVELEFPPAESEKIRADYVLKGVEKNVAIVEAKKLGTQIDDLGHRKQANGYAEFAEVKFFVLTNGAKWAVYERELMTSIERLKPKVEFDLAKDDPTRCALNALYLWRDNLGSESGPVVAKEPGLGPSVIVNGGGSSGGGQGTSDPTGKGWLKLSEEINVETGAPKPNRVVFPDGSELNIRNWAELWVGIAKWVINQGCFVDRFPIDKPMPEFRFGKHLQMIMKSDDEGFHAPDELRKDLWIDRHGAPRSLVPRISALLEHFGIPLDSIRVRFDES